jgi:curved DNA-binding protein CbpA
MDDEASSAARRRAKTTPSKADMESRIRNITKQPDDYYTVLGVEETATEAGLKKAYRTLALQLHPDKCSHAGAEEAFKIVGTAYRCLSDADKRRHYDLLGRDADNNNGPRVRTRRGRPSYYEEDFYDYRQDQAGREANATKRMLSFMLLMLVVLPAGLGWLATMDDYFKKEDIVHRVGVKLGLVPTYREQVHMLYSKLGVPQKTNTEVKQLLRKYVGKERKLLTKIEKKYRTGKKKQQKQKEQEKHWKDRQRRKRDGKKKKGASGK